MTRGAAVGIAGPKPHQNPTKRQLDPPRHRRRRFGQHMNRFGRKEAAGNKSSDQNATDEKEVPPLLAPIVIAQIREVGARGADRPDMTKTGGNAELLIGQQQQQRYGQPD